MKRFLSLALAFALVLTSLMVPAYAEDVADDTPAVETAMVDITSVNDGDTFAAGNNIALAADASGIENVKNIDFYANGAKLPGTIVGNRGSIVWYGAVEGVYDITTKVTYNGGATADGSEAVKLIVKPADESKIKLLWPSKELNWTNVGGGSYKETDKYAMFDNKALEIIPKGNTVGTLFTSDEPISRTWTTLAFVVYSPEEVPNLNVRRTGGTPNYTWGTGQQMVNNEFFRSPKSDSDLSVREGYNLYVTESGSYCGAKVTDGTGKYGNYNSEAKYLDFIRFTLTGAANDNDKPIYLLGIYGITGSMVTPVATPEIADGAQAVCNKVGTYRINFNSPIYPDATKVPAKVTYDVGGVATEVEGVTYTYGTDYVDLHLPDLALETKYTVSIQPNSILSYYTEGYYAPTSSKPVDRRYVAATDFTFSTKDTDCENATPVIKMTYPADGATCVGNTGFAAKVVAGSSAMTGVEFWKGETKLGDGIAMSDGEYWFQPETAVLTVGEANEITAKAVGTDITASATYTGATTPEYDVKGIYNDRVFVMQEEPSATITVVNKAHKSLVPTYALVDDIAKIEIYNKENVLIDTVTGTNEYTLTFDEYFDNKVTIKVYDIYGNIHPFEYDYYVADGVKNIASYVQDFNNISAEATQDEIISTIARVDSNGAIKTSDSFAYTIENGALKITNNHATKAQSFQVKNTAPNTGHKVHYYEFYVTHSAVNTFSSSVRTSFGSGNTDSLLSTGGYFDNGTTKVRTLPANTKKKVNIIIDYNYEIGDAPTCVINWGGEEWKQVKLTGYASETVNVGQNFLELSCAKNGAWIMIDDFKYTVYDVRPEYAVKGIYNGATMVKEEEATREITVVNMADSSTPTTIKTVELYKDGEVVATSGTETPNVVELRNDAYGSFDLEVKVTDIYDQVHPFTFEDCEVVEGVKNTEYSVDLQTFEDVADEDLADIIVAGGNISPAITLTTETYTNSNAGYYNSDGKALKIDASERTTFIQLSAPLNVGRKVHYYNFDLAMNNAFTKGLYVYGDGFDNEKSVQDSILTDEAFTTHSSNYNKVNVGLILDYNYAEDGTPMATVYLNGGEYESFALPNAITGSTDPVLVLKHDNKGGYIYIDNFKYSVYDYPSRFGLGEFETEIIFENTGTEEAPKYTGRKMFYPVATNMTDEAVTVRYFAAVYDAEGRLEHLYNDDNRLDDDEPGAEDYWDTSWTVTYEPGALNQESQFKFNMGSSAGRSAKLIPFVIGEGGVLDLAPIKLYE